MRAEEIIKTYYTENKNTSFDAFQIKAKEFLIQWYPFRGPLKIDFHPRGPVHDRESLLNLTEMYSKIEQLDPETTLEGLSVGPVYRKTNPELGFRNLLILSIKEEVIGYFDQLYSPGPKEPNTKI
ncbi:MAG: hypothetical protein IT244_03760 [Bacteroidia bacterium]|nr:hypothetical protein [Bacteroidia bacterium]